MLNNITTSITELVNSFKANQAERRKLRRHHYLLYKRASFIIILILIFMVIELSTIILYTR